MSQVQEITETTLFNEVLKGTTNEFVLVDFYGSDCVKCETLARVLDDLSTSLAPNLPIKKVFLESPHTESGVRFGLRGIPTLILFKSGEPIEQRTGSISRQEVVEVFLQHLR